MSVIPSPLTPPLSSPPPPTPPALPFPSHRPPKETTFFRLIHNYIFLRLRSFLRLGPNASAKPWNIAFDQHVCSISRLS